MKPKTLNFDQGRLFEKRLSELLNPKHPLYKLSLVIPWDRLEEKLLPYFAVKVGAPAKPIRLVAGLFMLQHCFDTSDKETVDNWVENPYWQFFCGYDYLQWELPIDPSSMVRWRKRLETKGAEAILEATIRAAEETGIVKPISLAKVIADTTVMEKNIAYPRDVRLYLACLRAMVREAKKRSIALRQTYPRVSKRHALAYSRYAHARQMKRAAREKKKLRTITGRVHRELKSWLEGKDDPRVGWLVERVEAILKQEKTDKNKIYSLHEDVDCIAKGKAHKKYEFGSKVSLVVTHKEGLVLSSRALSGNPYDGHTLEGALENAEKLSGRQIREAFVDKGYRGHKVERIKVWTSGMKKGVSRWCKKQMKRRQAIEPRIGHMKSEGRLKRNFLRGRVGDQIHAILCGVGENSRILLRGMG